MKNKVYKLKILVFCLSELPLYYKNIKVNIFSNCHTSK